MDLILLRHTKVDAAGICYGRLDVSLAETHAEQIGAAVESAPKPEKIATSPAHRCRVLAEALAARYDMPVDVDPRLAELDFGRWEGKAWADIPRAESDPWAKDPEWLSPPGGETFAALRRRVHAAVRDHGPATYVTHAGPIRALWMAAERLDFTEAFSRSVPHGLPLELRIDPAALKD